MDLFTYLFYKFKERVQSFFVQIFTQNVPLVFIMNSMQISMLYFCFCSSVGIGFSYLKIFSLKFQSISVCLISYCKDLKIKEKNRFLIKKNVKIFFYITQLFMLFQGGFSPPPFTLHPFFIFPHSTFYPFLSYGPHTPPSIPTFLFPPVTNLPILHLLLRPLPSIPSSNLKIFCVDFCTDALNGNLHNFCIT